MKKKIINNYKLLSKVFVNFLYYLKTTSKRYEGVSENACALINLDDKIMNQSGGRFSYLLCQYFEKSGYKIVLKTNFYYYIVLYPYKRLLLNKNYSFVRKMPTSSNSVVCKKNGKERHLLIRHGLNTIWEKSITYSLPFPMHPVQVDSYDKEQLIKLRSGKRSVKVFFSGSWTGEQYKRSLDRYNVFSRSEVMRFIIENFGHSNNLHLISDSKELYKLLHSQTYREQIFISDVKTRDEDWLKFLSIAYFFISPPGFRYPWCHNAVEAMAVGTIPILQYNHLFVPELKHMENCICYKSLDELQEAINKVLTMEEDEILKMKYNVITYYEKYLSPEAVVRHINQFSNSDETQLEIGMPYID